MFLKGHRMKFSDLASIETCHRQTQVLQTIAEDDEMWPGAEQWYFIVGHDGLQNVLRALSLSRLQSVHHILDLPCGHGRVARHLRAAFPAARLTFCDLNQSAVDFCSKELRGIAVYASSELTDVEFDTTFDVIWIGSLFTHIDLDRAEKWMRHLCKCLAPDGVLIATFHGAWTIQQHATHGALIGPAEWEQILAGFRNDGWGYANYPHLSDFGVSLSRASRVIDMASAIEGCRILSYTERGWAGNHDVLVLSHTDRLEKL
jgi:SAM-dependent methyltransferase